VCRDDMSFIKADTAWDELASSLGENTLILQYTHLDKRTKFYTHFEVQMVWFNHLDERLLTKYIQQEMNISPKNCQTLIKVCESDYSRLMLELDKVGCWKRGYAQDKQQPIPDDGAVLHLLQSGAIYIPPDDAIFDWVHAMLQGKSTLAFQLYEECQKIGEPALRLLLVLFNGVKHLLQVQACPGNISKSTGLSQWEIKQVSDCEGIYHNYELVNAMKLIHSMEYGIKVGTVEESFAVPYVMVNMLGAYEV